jgi:hypothetical protein
MEVAMEDIVYMRLLFVAGLLVMSGVMALLALAITWLGEWVRPRSARIHPVRPRVKDIPVGGTR